VTAVTAQRSWQGIRHVLCRLQVVPSLDAGPPTIIGPRRAFVQSCCRRSVIVDGGWACSGVISIAEDFFMGDAKEMGAICVAIWFVPCRDQATPACQRARHNGDVHWRQCHCQSGLVRRRHSRGRSKNEPWDGKLFAPRARGCSRIQFLFLILGMVPAPAKAES